MDSLERIARETKEQVLFHMRETRPGKYDGILRGLKAFKYLMLLQTKGNVPEALIAKDINIGTFLAWLFLV